jgi:hypothetical protein
MKKILILFIPTASIFVLLIIVGAYFIEDIFNLLKLSRAMNSSVVTGSNIQTLIGLSLVGFVAIIRKRPPKR